MTDQDLLNAIRGAQASITEAFHDLDDLNIGRAKEVLQSVSFHLTHTMIKWHEQPHPSPPVGFKGDCSKRI